MAKLNASDVAPDFQLADHHGKTVQLTDFRGDKLLLYFYPKADTPGRFQNTEVSVSQRSKAASHSSLSRAA